MATRASEGYVGTMSMCAQSGRTPSHAERCRTLTSRARTATLSTLARDPVGYPFGSLVTVTVDGAGRPLLLLSRLAEHTQNLLARSEASLLVTDPPDDGASPLAGARVTLLGPCSLVPEAELQCVRAAFLGAHVDATTYADFPDFGFYRLEPVALRYVGGFGRMSWVSREEYLDAEPDPLASHSAGILDHMNGDHADAVLAYARVLAGFESATAATMIAVDRYGFDVAASTPDGPKTARLSFDAPVGTSDEVRRAMIAMVRAARGSGSST